MSFMSYLGNLVVLIAVLEQILFILKKRMLYMEKEDNWKFQKTPKKSSNDVFEWPLA